MEKKQFELKKALKTYYCLLFKPLEQSDFRKIYPQNMPGPYDDCPDPENTAQSKEKKVFDARP